MTRPTEAAPIPLLVRMPNYVGDSVLSLPALRVLQEGGYRLHLLGRRFLPALMSGDPSIRVSLQARGWKARIRQVRELGRLARAEAPGRPLALALPNSFSSAIELRVGGFRVAGAPTDGRGWLLSQRLSHGTDVHQLARLHHLALDLVGQDRRPPVSIDLRLPAASLEQATRLAAGLDAGRGFVCVAPFVGASSIDPPKKWQGFPDVVRVLLEDGWPVVICPGPGEVDEAHTRYPGAIVIQDLPLDVYAALLGHARLVIAGDTGPAHLAAAVGAPLISVPGPTSIEMWGPWGPTVVVAGRDGRFPAVAEMIEQVRRTLGAPSAPSHADANTGR